MVRLRCCLLQLQLLLAIVVVVSGNIEPEWQLCGILNYCLVHSSCFNAAQQGATAGWRYFKNMGNYSVPKFPDGYQQGLGGTCFRYITISPVEESFAKKVKVVMVDNDGKKANGLNLAFGPTPLLKFVCLNNRMQILPDSSGFSFNDPVRAASNDEKIDCKFTLETQDDTDIREKLTIAAGGTFTKNNNGETKITTKGTLIVSGTDDLATAYSTNIGDVDLTTLKILCKGERVDRIRDVNMVNLDEFEAWPKAELLLLNPKYTRGNEGWKAFEDDDRIQCPPDAPMQYKKDAGSQQLWKHVKDGLVCHRGFLTMTLDHDVRERVQTSDHIKCARKKCGVCEAPPKMEGHAGATKPIFDEAKEGDKCRTLKCDQPFMVAKKKGINEMVLHRKSSEISCSEAQTRSTSENETITSKDWVLDGYHGELDEVYCTTDVYCKLINPVQTEPCEGGGNATCQEALISEKYDDGKGACPVGFDVVYKAPATGNQIILSTFKCDKSIGKWEAIYNQTKVAIVNDATIRCVKTKEPEAKPPNEKIFLGLTAIEVGCFAAGIFLLVVAVIVAATFYVCMVKKRKAAKKKAMESVSVTFKEPPKYKKGKHGSKRDRKERQVSVINSTTGSLSGPASGSGASTPIAPPSQLLPPGKGVSKPDKGCAVLDINTGESKQMKWTNHAGDGPPTQRPTWQQSDSKQEDIQSAIKFAPGELEAARKKAKINKKKEKSRQNSIEYNLGDPRQVKIDKSNIVNFDSSSTKN